MAAHSRTRRCRLSRLVEEELQGLSPIQAIMKMTEDDSIRALGLDPANVISFGGGWCNHTAPEALRETYKEITQDKQLFHQSGRYSPIVGDSLCREQLCMFEDHIFGLKKLEPRNILLGQSSTQLFQDVLRVVCDPGEPVCFLDPTYANYRNAVKCALPRSKMLFLPALDPTDWTYLADPETALEQLKQYCQDGLRMLVIPVPDNPTSQIPSDEFLRNALEIMRDACGYLLLDHAYKTLWFGAMPHCFSWSPVENPNLITVHTNSKWLSSLGRRLGWVEADAAVITGFEKVNESVILSPDTLHSMTTARFLQRTLQEKSLKTYIEETRRLYEKTAEVMITAIDTHLGWKRLTPQGGLYTSCPTPAGEDPVKFVERVLKETGVLLIPGIGFGPSMEHAVRISYGTLCYEHDHIREGIERIGKYLGTTH